MFGVNYKFVKCVVYELFLLCGRVYTGIEVRVGIVDGLYLDERRDGTLLSRSPDEEGTVTDTSDAVHNADRPVLEVWSVGPFDGTDRTTKFSPSLSFDSYKSWRPHVSDGSYPSRRRRKKAPTRLCEVDHNIKATYCTRTVS